MIDFLRFMAVLPIGLIVVVLSALHWVFGSTADRLAVAIEFGIRLMQRIDPGGGW